MSDQASPRAAQRRPGPRPLRGGVGQLTPYKVHGWAFDPAAPHVRLEARVFLDEECIGEARADLYRPDLINHGIGDGQYGFTFNTDRKMPVEAPERVTVRVRNPESGLELDLKPRTQPPGPRPATAPGPRPATSPGPRPATPPAAAGPEARRPLSPALPQRPAAATPVPPGPPVAAPAVKATQPEGAPERPVFVLGAARSGTSAMAQAIFRNTRYAGHGEGHLLDVTPHLLQVVETHYRTRAGERRPGINTMIAAVEPGQMVEAIAAGLSTVTRRLFPGGYWLDKTPGASMIEAVPALLRIWPEARFIFMRRRAIENLASRGRKFPKEDFDNACRRWADCLAGWEKVRGSLAGRALEVDWLLMARDPARVAEAVARLIDLDAEEHRRLRQALQVDLPERTSDRFAEVLDGLPADLDAEQRRIFATISEPWMRKAGYDDTARYWQPGAEARALQVL